MNPSQFIDGRDLRIAGLEAQNEALAARVAALEGLLNLSDEMVELLEEGECPWRDGTSSYREWYEGRECAAKAYRKLRDKLEDHYK